MTAHAAADALDAAHVRSFHEQGFLVVRQVFGADEIAALANEAVTLAGRSELIDTNNLRCRWADHAETGECMFDCFDPVIDIGPVCRYVAHDERILAVLRTIYHDEPCLFKDKLIFKRPGAKGYGLHQDYIGWREFPESFATVILAIDPTDAENGATEVFPNYHAQGYMSERDGEYHELATATVDEAKGAILELQPGDLAIFSGFTPHRSAPNLSQRWRRQLYLSYNAHADGGNMREAHYRQFESWLREKYAQYGRTDVYFR